MNKLSALMHILTGGDRKQLVAQENTLRDHETRLTALEERQLVRDTFKRVAGGGK